METWRPDAGVSGKAIPRPPAGPMQDQMALLDQRPQMLLDRVAAGAADPDGLGHRHPAMLALHLLFEALLLALQSPKEELQPGIPIRRFGADGSLRPPERQVVAFLALLDHALQRTVRDVGIAGPQSHQRRQDARESAVAVLERMNFQKHHDEHPDHQQWVKAPFLLRPGDPFRHLRTELQMPGIISFASAAAVSV